MRSLYKERDNKHAADRGGDSHFVLWKRNACSYLATWCVVEAQRTSAPSLGAHTRLTRDVRCESRKQVSPGQRGNNELAAKLLEAKFTATAALIAIMLKNLPDEVRTRTFDAVRNGMGKVELRTRVESNETELVLVPTDGSEALWLTRTRS